MPAPDNLFVSAFRYQRLGFLMAAILTIMIYLACLTVAGQFVLARTAQSWSHDLANKMTVEIALPSSGKSVSEQESLALESVRNLPGIEEATHVSETEMRALLQSWLGDKDLVSTLPLPLLIDVRLKPGTAVEESALNQALASAHLGTGRIHTYVARTGPVAAVVRSLNILVVFLLTLTGIAVTAVIALTCRAALAAQHETIDLLHTLGAENAMIARAFQTHVKAWVGPACMIGFAAAAITLAGLSLALGSSFDLALYGALTVVMACVPVAALVLALGTARLSVLNLLRRLA